MEPARPLRANLPTGPVAVKLELREDGGGDEGGARQPRPRSSGPALPKQELPPQHQQRNGPAPLTTSPRRPTLSALPPQTESSPGSAAPVMIASSAQLRPLVPASAAAPTVRRGPVPVLPRPPDLPHRKPQPGAFHPASFVPVYVLGTPPSTPAHTAASRMLLQPPSTSTSAAPPNFASLLMPLPPTLPKPLPIRPPPERTSTPAKGAAGGKKRGVSSSSLGSGGGSSRSGATGKKAKSTTASQAPMASALQPPLAGLSEHRPLSSSPRQLAAMDRRPSHAKPVGGQEKGEEAVAVLLGPLLTAVAAVAGGSQPSPTRQKPAPLQALLDVATADLSPSRTKPLASGGSSSSTLASTTSSSDRKQPASSSSTSSWPNSRSLRADEVLDEDDEGQAEAEEEAVSTLGSLRMRVRPSASVRQAGEA